MMNLEQRTAAMRDFFNRKAEEDYDGVHLKMMENKRRIAQRLPEGTVRVLDLGGGTGLELVPVFERFAEAQVTVMDISEGMLKVLRTRPFADHLTILCGDFFSMDFGKDYDAVISSAALHHFSETDKLRLYRKVLESLRPGGVFVNSDRCAESQERQDFLFHELEVNAASYVHLDTLLTVENERRLLEDAGFVEFSASAIEGGDYWLISAVRPAP